MKTIELENVSKIYSTSLGKKIAVNKVSFSVEEGTLTVIGGENGSGKSVLMNIISGLEKATSGKVKINSKVGLVFQEADSQILGETVEEDVSFGPKNQKKSKEEIKILAENALKEVGLFEKKDFPARFLSGGEKRRLAVACMLSMNLPVLIFDEPYANLDYTGVKQVNSLIRKLKEQRKTVIILTHELEKCLGFADKFLVLFRGNKVFEGSVEEGLKQNLEEWNIHNPLVQYNKISDLIWE